MFVATFIKVLGIHTLMWSTNRILLPSHYFWKVVNLSPMFSIKLHTNSVKLFNSMCITLIQRSMWWLQIFFQWQGYCEEGAYELFFISIEIKTMKIGLSTLRVLLQVELCFSDYQTMKWNFPLACVYKDKVLSDLVQAFKFMWYWPLGPKEVYKSKSYPEQLLKHYVFI